MKGLIGVVIAFAIFSGAGCGGQSRAAGCSGMGKAIAQADAASYADGLAHQPTYRQTRAYIKGLAGEKCLTESALRAHFGSAKNIVADCPQCISELNRAEGQG